MLGRNLVSTTKMFNLNKNQILVVFIVYWVTYVLNSMYTLYKASANTFTVTFF